MNNTKSWPNNFADYTSPLLSKETVNYALLSKVEDKGFNGCLWIGNNSEGNFISHKHLFSDISSSVYLLFIYKI